MKAKAPKTKDGQLLKQVTVSFGVTVNMGDYESARVDVTESDWVTEDEKEEKYTELWESVSSQVRKQLDRVTGVENEEEPKKKSKTKRKAR